MFLRKLSALLTVVALSAVLGCQETPPADEGADEETAAQTTPAEFNVAGLPTVEISVPGMMCEHSCVPKVRESLAARPGVKDVKVDLETKKATVAVDENEFDAEAAVADLLDQGFQETKIAATPADGQSQVN